MAASSALMASQTLTLTNPTFLSPHNRTFLSPPLHSHHQAFNFSKPFTLSLRNPNPKTPFLTLRKSRVFASSSSSSSSASSITPKIQSSTPILPQLAGSTRTITTIFAIAQLVSKFIAHKIGTELIAIHGIREGLAGSMGPLLFACISESGNRPINTPFTVIAAGMAKWLDIYSGVLLVRVLLSWFPTIPWEKQPLSAIRDLCDPYLNLFRGIIPPLMNTLDISPLFAFSVLGALASLLRQGRRY